MFGFMRNFSTAAVRVSFYVHHFVELGIARLDPQTQVHFVGGHADFRRTGDPKWLDWGRAR
jgi:hypothetical protein